MSKRNEIIALLLVVIVCAMCTIAIVIKLNSDADGHHIVEISSDGKIVRICDLEKTPDQTFTIESKYGKNTIKIENSKISVVNSDCPDKICISMGELKSDLTPIVCLPHKLIISFTEKTIES